jgi:threonine dehydratase
VSPPIRGARRRLNAAVAAAGGDYASSSWTQVVRRVRHLNVGSPAGSGETRSWWAALARDDVVIAATVSIEDVRRARESLAGVARRTPVLDSPGLSEQCGGEIVLKAENLQRTSSFKLRGALAKIAALGDAAAGGVVCGSAGNHAQATAAAARARDVGCEVFMPDSAPIAKVDAVESLGATVHLVPGPVEDAVEAARARGRVAGIPFIHPFDDADVIAGQGTLGLELVEEIPELARIVVPVGGGALAAGLALAVRSERPDVDVIGVQAEACAPFPASLRGHAPVTVPAALTIADGIAVAQPGEITFPLVDRWLAGVEVVGEDAIGEAMIVLLERAKLVVEGAGAVGVAALLAGRVQPARAGLTAVVLSGGNVDVGLLAALARRQETAEGRRLVLLTRLSDRPGELARLLTAVAGVGANVIEIAHVREGLDLHLPETAVELVLETRAHAHARQVVRAIEEAGFGTRLLR